MIILGLIMLEQFMSQIKISYFTIGLVALSVLFGIAYVVYQKDSTSYTIEIKECAELHADSSSRINCWMGVIRTVFEEEGTEEAFGVFTSVYETYTDFSGTGCHLHAHRMGDMSYYYDYLYHQDMTQMDFPKNSISCGYGFYHGFIEHLIQDRPEIDFVEEQCVYLVDRLCEIAPVLQGVCYHAGGHGFMMARADELRDPSEWTISNFTTPPLEKCDALETVSKHLKHECRQGVYNVFTNWMEVGEYGFTYNAQSPYEYCDTVENIEHQTACYIEMTRKIEYGSGTDPLSAFELIQTGNREDMEKSLLIIAVAGMVMHDPYGDQEYLTTRCRLVDAEKQQSCFKSIVHGLFEHGIPGREYYLANQFCSSEFLLDVEVGWCHQQAAQKLNRFRTNSEIQNICSNGDLSEQVCSIWKILS